MPAWPEWEGSGFVNQGRKSERVRFSQPAFYVIVINPE